MEFSVHNNIQIHVLLSYVRLVMIVLAACFGTYAVHRRIQREYYLRCASDIVQVLFFRDSTFCLTLRSVGDFMEMNYAKVFMKIYDLL